MTTSGVKYPPPDALQMAYRRRSRVSPGIPLAFQRKNGTLCVDHQYGTDDLARRAPSSRTVLFHDGLSSLPPFRPTDRSRQDWSGPLDEDAIDVHR